MCVCQSIPLSYPEISVIPLQLSLKVIFFRLKQDKSIASTPVFQYFRLRKAHFFPLPEFWCLGKEAYVRVICQRAIQSHINSREVFHFLRVRATD